MDETGQAQGRMKELTAIASALKGFCWRGPVAFVDAVDAVVGRILLRRGRRGRR